MSTSEDTSDWDARVVPRYSVDETAVDERLSTESGVTTGTGTATATGTVSDSLDATATATSDLSETSTTPDTASRVSTAGVAEAPTAAAAAASRWDDLGSRGDGPSLTWLAMVMGGSWLALAALTTAVIVVSYQAGLTTLSLALSVPACLAMVGLVPLVAIKASPTSDESWFNGTRTNLFIGLSIMVVLLIPVVVVGGIYAGVLGQLEVDLYEAAVFPDSGSPAMAALADDKLYARFGAGPVIGRDAAGEVFGIDGKSGSVRFIAVAAPLVSASSLGQAGPACVSAFACLCNGINGCRAFPAVNHGDRSRWDVAQPTEYARVTSTRFLRFCRDAAFESMSKAPFATANATYALTQGMGLGDGITFWEPTRFDLVRQRVGVVLWSVIGTLVPASLAVVLVLLGFAHYTNCFA